MGSLFDSRTGKAARENLVSRLKLKNKKTQGSVANNEPTQLSQPESNISQSSSLAKNQESSRSSFVSMLDDEDKNKNKKFLKSV